MRSEDGPYAQSGSTSTTVEYLRWRWSDVIRTDMKEKGVKIEEAQDRRTYRMKT